MQDYSNIDLSRQDELHSLATSETARQQFELCLLARHADRQSLEQSGDLSVFVNVDDFGGRRCR